MKQKTAKERYLDGMPSRQQMKWLLKHGYSADRVANMTRREANAIVANVIERLIAGKGA